MLNIFALARDTKEQYENGLGIDLVEGLTFDMYVTLRENEFLSSGHYMSGDYNDDNDIKPFHDIITRILENQRSAEEIDTKDMEIATKDPNFYTRAMFVSKFNQDWMDDTRMDKLLNDAIETRGKTGGLLLKVLETPEDLKLEVADWNNFSGDAADLEEGVKVFNFYYTPAKLMEVANERGWDIDATKLAIELYATADQNDVFREQRITTGEYIKVREISGVLSKQYMTNDEDDESEEVEEYEYSYQLHYIAGAEYHSEQEGEQGQTLSSQELDKSPFYYLPYKKRTTSGKTLGIGMVERGKHAQVETNKGAQWYDQSMQFSATHVLQSSSKNLKGKNVLTNITPGTIIKTDDGKGISGVDMSPQALAHLGNFMAQWQNQVDRATGTYAVATGEELPSGTPYRLGAILDQNAQSAFDLRREEMAIFLNQIYTDRIIPFFIKQMSKKSELALKFSPEELKKLDEDVAQYKADKTVVDKYLNGEYDNIPPVMKFAVMDTEREQIMTDVDRELKKGKNRRTITGIPDGYWKGTAEKLFVDITGERRDKGTVLESVNNVLLQYLQYKPQLDADPEARKLFNNIVEIAGLEPIAFETPTEQPQQPQQLPQGQQKPKSGLENPEQLTSKPQ